MCDHPRCRWIAKSGKVICAAGRKINNNRMHDRRKSKRLGRRASRMLSDHKPGVQRRSAEWLYALFAALVFQDAGCAMAEQELPTTMGNLQSLPFHAACEVHISFGRRQPSFQYEFRGLGSREVHAFWVYAYRKIILPRKYTIPMESART